MLSWMAYWIWWMAWRVAITLACVFTIQQVIHRQNLVWVETQPFLVGTALFVLLIRIWSQPRPTKDNKQCSTSDSFFSDT